MSDLKEKHKYLREVFSALIEQASKKPDSKSLFFYMGRLYLEVCDYRRALDSEKIKADIAEKINFAGALTTSTLATLKEREAAVFLDDSYVKAKTTFEKIDADGWEAYRWMILLEKILTSMAENKPAERAPVAVHKEKSK